MYLRFYSTPDPTKIRDALHQTRVQEKAEEEKLQAEIEEKEKIKKNLEDVSGHSQATIDQIMQAMEEASKK